MKHLFTVLFTGFIAISLAQSNPEQLEFVNENNGKVLITPMGDSLKIEYPSYKASATLYLDMTVMEVEGYAYYSGTCGSFDVSVQFLDEKECTVDSEVDEFTMGICIQKETNVEEGDFSTGRGSGAAHVREMIRKPNTDVISTNETCIIVLKVIVDPEGNVVGTPTVERARTTTDNTELIRKVIEIVKKEMRYTKSPGKAMASMTIRVKLTAK
jgi:hypothetical protein